MKLALSARASLAALAIVVAGVTACDDDSTSPPQNAQVRFVHAAAGVDEVNFRVDGADVRTDVAFGDDASAYGNVAAGSRKLAARVADEDEDLAGVTKDLSLGSQYTAVLLNGIDSRVLQLYADTNTAAAAGKTRLRVIHTTQAAGALDVYVTDADADLEDAEPVLSEVGMTQASKYVEVASGERRIRFTDAGTKDVVLDIEDIDLPDAGVRTVFVIAPEESGMPLQSIVSEDRG